MKMASLRVVDYWRRSARSKELVIGSGEDLDLAESSPSRRSTPDQDPLQRILDDQDLKQFWYALTQELTLSEYRVALLTWEMGFPDDEIARALETSRRAVSTHRSRARREIVEIVNRRDARIRFDHGSTGEDPHTELFGGGGALS